MHYDYTNKVSSSLLKQPQIVMCPAYPLRHMYLLLDVLWCQPIKNFMNIDGTTLILFFSSPPFSAGPQKHQTSTVSKIKCEKFRFFIKKIGILVP